MKTLYLIDANSIVHRTFHALPPLTSPGGEPVQALYGLAVILLKILRENKPDYMAALFDRPEPTFRKKQYSEYKAHRPETPSELKSQLARARDLFGAFGIKTFSSPGYEADDLIATFADRYGNSRDVQIAILSGDLDPLQLVKSDKVVLVALRRGVSETTRYDERTVMEKYGLAPSQMVDYKSLVGDASDNVKGVPGIGPKTAREILEKYKNIETAMRKMPPDSRVGKKLRGGKDKLELARSLVKLERNVPADLPGISELELREPGEETKNYFLSLGFKTLAERLEAKSSPKQTSLF